jgi:hypothetical protein
MPHLRQLTPLPEDELLALKRSIAELGSIGRNIYPDREGGERRRRGARSLLGEFWAMLKICSALRDNIKALLSANLASWAAGHAGGDK